MMNELHVTTGGPSVSRLRRSVGSRQPLVFGSDDHTVEVTVDMIYAVGCNDLPVQLPRGSINDATSVWLVAGSVENQDQDDTNVLVIYAATHPARTAMIIEDLDSAQTASLVPFFAIQRMFVKALREAGSEP